METQLLGSEGKKSRPRGKRRPLQGKQGCPGGNYQDNAGSIITKRAGHSIRMEKEDQAVCFWSNCCILRDLKAEI